MNKVGITGGDASFDLATVDGQTCYVRLTAHGLLRNIYTSDICHSVFNAKTMLDVILETLGIPVLIDCDYETGYCYSIDVCSERVYTPHAGGLPR